MHRVCLASLVVLGLVIGLAACNTSPDKRLLQYLNTDGFGNRYRGNSEEENWLAIGDSLGLTDAYHPLELNVNVPVDIDGTVLLPEIGAVSVAGLTRTEVEALLMEKYSPYYDLLDVKVKITTGGKKYFIFGEVTGQGSKPFTGDITIFEAVTDADPKPDSANLGRVRLIRADPRDPQIQVINLSEIIDTGDSTFNVLVHERDIIYVPPTFLARIGYALQTALFPIRIVLTSLAGAIWSLGQISYYQDRGFF